MKTAALVLFILMYVLMIVKPKFRPIYALSVAVIFLATGILPISGLRQSSADVMPAVSLGLIYAASITRLTRTNILDAMHQDYVRTARAKGVDERQIVVHHCLRNALLPIITVIGVDFGYVLGGSVVIESVFALGGLGTLLITAIRMKDTPIVMGAVMFITLAYSLVNLAVDLIYTFVDPRIKSQYQKG